MIEGVFSVKLKMNDKIFDIFICKAPANMRASSRGKT